jgi:hypothetical protein
VSSTAPETQWEALVQTPAASTSPFSVHRAFVVQFRAETDPAQGRVVGRIEHVASQQTALFQSWAEMQAFIAQILTNLETQSSAGF